MEQEVNGKQENILSLSYGKESHEREGTV